MTRNRLTIAVLATCLGLALVIAGAFVPTTLGGYLSAVMLQIGSAIFLVPAVLWLERQFNRRVDRLISSLAGDSQAVQAARNVGLDTLWESVFPAFDRLRHAQFRTTLTMQVGSIWLVFYLYDNYSAGLRGSWISLYRFDPGPKPEGLGDLITWTEGTTLRRALDQVVAQARRGNLAEDSVRLDKDEVVRQLQQALTGGLAEKDDSVA